MSTGTSKWHGFVCGGLAACTAETITLPIDTAKVRLQLLAKQAKGVARPGMAGVLTGIYTNEGPKALFRGWVPAIHRQLAFASLRLGLYGPIRDIFVGKSGNEASFLQRLGAGLTSGAIAISIANPTDLVKVRMQAPPGSTGPKYSGAMNAYGTIVRQEGVAGLWTGWGPNVLRNSVICAVELGVYDQAKSKLRLMGMSEGSLMHVTAACIAGFCATVVGSPVDVIKTRVMNSRNSSPTGIGLTPAQVLKELMTTEGPRALYNGFLPNFLRIAGWNAVMFVTFEKLLALVATPAAVTPP